MAANGAGGDFDGPGEAPIGRGGGFLSRVALEHQARVGAAEPETVGEHPL